MRPLADDTSLDIEARQIRAWREMPAARKADLITACCRSSREMSLAGIRSRHPDASPREQFLRLAMLTLGVDLARRAYPEIDQLGLA
jgi:hypothetical protein